MHSRDCIGQLYASSADKLTLKIGKKFKVTKICKISTTSTDASLIRGSGPSVPHGLPPEHSEVDMNR